MRRAKPIASKPTEKIEKTKRPLPTVKAMVIGVDVNDHPFNLPGRSNVETEDAELERMIGQGQVIEPPYDPLVLCAIAEQSTNLDQNITALEINIDGFGYKFPRRNYLQSPTLEESLRNESMAEFTYLENFFSGVCLDYSFTNFRRRLRRDYEVTGNCYFEVVRNQEGRIDQFVHVPAYQMRLSPLDKEPMVYTRKRIFIKPDGTTAIKEEKVIKRFRRVVQFARLGVTSIGRSVYSKPVWFKEFGDPRRIDAETGEVVTEKTPPKKNRRLATEIVHWKLYSPRSIYGIPRWIGNLITVLGDQEADSVNFHTLKNNNMPSMIVAVAGGSLTQASIERIQQYVKEQVKGPNRSRFIILETESSFQTESGDLATPKINVTPLSSNQSNDQLFQVFGDKNRSKIRESFRLPPIFVGRSEVYNKATAETSRKLADEQIFAPERNEEDYWFNQVLFPELSIRHHKFQTLGPNVTDDEDLIRILIAAEKTGGMTPRIARMIIEDIMGKDFPENWKDMDPDVPLVLQLADRVKNQAPVSLATQLAPIGVDAEMAKLIGGTPSEAETVVKALLGLRNAMEAELSQEA